MPCEKCSKTSCGLYPPHGVLKDHLTQLKQYIPSGEMGHAKVRKTGDGTPDCANPSSISYLEHSHALLSVLNFDNSFVYREGKCDWLIQIYRVVTYLKICNKS